MCGIVGIINYTKDLSKSNYLIKNMNEKISRRGPDNEGYYIEKNVLLGHKRLAIIDIEKGIQPMSFKHNENIYTIVYNGQIYNSNEIRNNLLEIRNKFFNTFRYRSFIKKLYILW